MNEFMFREGKGFERYADITEVSILKKTMVCKHVTPQHEVMTKLYNVKGETIGIDIVQVSEKISVVIDDMKKRKTIVVLKNKDGKSFRATARCHDDDVYDPQLGYNIANSRAIIKREEANLAKLLKGGK